jgi:hypothetical protein
MSKYEVMIDAKRGYRFIVEADNPDDAYEKAQIRYLDDEDDGDEGGYEDIVSTTCTSIDEELDNTVKPVTTTRS